MHRNDRRHQSDVRAVGVAAGAHRRVDPRDVRIMGAASAGVRGDPRGPAAQPGGARSVGRRPHSTRRPGGGNDRHRPCRRLCLNLYDRQLSR